MAVVTLLTLSMFGFAQSYEIKGALMDTADYNYVNTASITIISAKDSIMHGFSRADDEGKFSITVKEAGKYMILASHPTFATYIDQFEVKESITDLGEINMTTKKTLLEGVIISAERAIMIKGDTVIYSADSFNVRAYDNVDELLKKLPGLEVSKDGSITAHGEKVQKMFVDGEEFFSDDPAILAKTLRASAVDKVQVFNDKSENAKNTGVDDGERIKTINLTLKDDAKKGYMGKLRIGGALPDFYEGEAMIQAYKNKRKLSAYVMTGNTNNQLSWSDRRNFGGGSGSHEISDDGSFVYEGYDFNSDNSGLPKSTNGGLFYSNKWFEDKLSLNANYTLKDRQVDKTDNSTTKYILPGDNQTITNSNSNSHSKTFSNDIIARSDIKFDSSSNLNIRVNGSISKVENDAETNTFARNNDGTLINSSNRLNKGTTNSERANISLTYRKRFAKEGRSFSAGLDGSYNHSKTDGLLLSNNRIIATNTDIDFNQIKDNQSSTSSFGVRLTYTEPIIKNVYLEVNYAFNNSLNEANFKTYDVVGNTETYNPLYSNEYTFNYYSNKGGINFRYSTKKLKASLGSDISDAQFNQKNKLHTANSRSYGYFNVFPRANFNYSFNTYTNLNLSYRGSTQQPTIDQLQPIVINTDPTNIMIGNENLTQQFNHTINANYNSFSVLKNQYMYIGGFATLTQNPIVQSQVIDATGFRTYQFVNSKNSQSYNFWGGFNKRLVTDFKMDVSLRGGYNRAYNYSNGFENINDYYNIAPGIGLSYDKDTTIRVAYRFTPTYNNSKSSLSTQVDNEFWNYAQVFDFSYLLPYGIKVGTDVTWNIRPAIGDYIQKNDIMTWNAYISKAFLKDRSLEAKIYCYDILNQNKGYNDFVLGNQITSNNYNVIKQYFMFSLTWNFTKFGGMSKSKETSATND